MSVTVLRKLRQACRGCSEPFEARLLHVGRREYEPLCGMCKRLRRAQELYQEAGALIREAKEIAEQRKRQT